MGLLTFKVPETTLKTEKSETTVENGNEDSAMSPEDRDFLLQALDAFQSARAKPASGAYVSIGSLSRFFPAQHRL